MKKIYLGLIALLSIFTACSDVELPSSASDAVERVNSLAADYQDGSRQVTLHWTNPSAPGQTGIRIIKDGKDIMDFDGVFDSYLIKKAPTNVEVSYTIMARYGDVLSEGQTVRFFINYEAKKGGNLIAMLVPNDYNTGSADEKDAVAWFQKNYVSANKGVLLTPATIDDLDIEKHSACWVMCDRVGIERGWKNLPAALVSNATIEALKAYAADGGNLFLTNHATQLTVALDRISETYAPVIYGSGEGGQNDDIWGVHPIIGREDLGEVYDHRGHEIYQGMTYEPTMYAGIYCFEGPGIKGDHNCMWDMNAISGVVENPNKIKDFEEKTNSTVLGTWNHVVDYCCAGIVDFDPTTTFKGRILAVGLAAYEWNLGGTPNSKQDQLELFTANCLKYIGMPVESKVAMLVPGDDATLSADEKAAVTWFRQNYVNKNKGVVLTPANLDDLSIETNPMCWVMCDRVGIERGWKNLPAALVSNATIEALKAYAADGGNLFLTNHATQLTVALDRISETYAPVIYGSGEGGQNDDIWGVHPIIGREDLGEVYDHRGHEIYQGMTYEPTMYAGIYCFEGPGIKGDHNCMWDMNAISGVVENPNKIKDFEEKTNSTVLGTWNHVVDYCCAGIVDFAPTTTFPGRILAVGLAAYEWDLGGVPNTKQDQLNQFTSNCITYLK